MCKDFAVGVDNYVQTLAARSPSRVLITVPHDGVHGLELEPFVPRRINGTVLHDGAVWPIVRDAIGAYPVNVVRGLMSRRFLDYNRAPEDAFELPQFEALYQKYHGAIYVHLQQMLRHSAQEELLLLDVHGFSNQPPYAPRDGYDLILGTGNRETILHGAPDEAFAEFFRQRGYSVFLPKTQAQTAQDDWLNGNFTVRTVARELGVNAIQVEIARRFRVRDAAVIGTRLSADLAAFLEQQYRR